MIYDPFPRHPTTSGRANVCAHARTARVIGIVQDIDTNRPRRKTVKVGRGKNARTVKRVVFK